jgi:hypothetical protein
MAELAKAQQPAEALAKDGHLAIHPRAPARGILAKASKGVAPSLSTLGPGGARRHTNTEKRIWTLWQTFFIVQDTLHKGFSQHEVRKSAVKQARTLAEETPIFTRFYREDVL